MPGTKYDKRSESSQSAKMDDMDLDELQEKLGGISRYQVVLIFVVSFLPFGTSFMSQTSVFFSAVPDHRCSVPPIDDVNIYPNLTEDNITSLLIPPGDSCHRYAYNLSGCADDNDLSCVTNQSQAEVIECDNGYTYDDTYYEETTVSEWDLICERRTLDSVANSLYFFGIFVGSAIVGPLMDWSGRKRSMLIMCLLLVVSGIACTFSPSYEVYIAMRVLEAVAGIPCFVAFFTYVSEMSDRKGRTFAGIYGQLVGAVSHTLLPVLAYFLRDWRDLSLACSLLPLPYVAIHFFIPRSPRWLLSNSMEDEARVTVARYAESKGKILDDADWEMVVSTERNKLRALAENKKYAISDLFLPPLMRMVSFNVMYLWFVVSMVFYGLTLNVGVLAGNPYVNSVLNAFVEIIGFLIYMVMSYNIGRRLTSTFSYSMSGFCCLTSMLLLEFAGENQAMIDASRWVAIMGKLFATMCFAIVYQYTSEVYPTVARGTGMSLGSMSARVGSMIMPFTLQIQENVPWLTQTIFGVLAVIAGLSSLLLPETLTADLMTTVEEAENFYRTNMPFTAKLMGKTDIYKTSEKVEDVGEDNIHLNNDFPPVMTWSESSRL